MVLKSQYTSKSPKFYNCQKVILPPSSAMGIPRLEMYVSVCFVIRCFVDLSLHTFAFDTVYVTLPVFH